MAEKLGENGNPLLDVSRAVKIATELQEKKGQLQSVIEQTRKQGDVIEKLEIKDEPLFDNLKSKVRKVCVSAGKLETWFVLFGREICSFEKFVRNNIRGSTIPPEVLSEYISALERTHSMATAFSEYFEAFIKSLNNSKDAAIKMADRMKQKEQELQNQASSAATKGGLVTAGLVIAGAGLVALGFFTGGATWVAAGAAAGAVCVAGAVTVGVKTSLDVKKLQELAGGITNYANKLESIGRHLKGISDKAGEIKMDKKALDMLQTALNLFQQGQVNREIAQLKAKLAAAGLN